MNFWGYSSVNFFSPMIRYAAAGHSDCGLKAINEFKLLVREAHKLKIEVHMFASFALLGISFNIVIITF